MFTFLYKMYVRQYLEYCVQLWSSYLTKDIDTLEKYRDVRATKYAQGLSHLLYETRLYLYSLFCRRND